MDKPVTVAGNTYVGPSLTRSLLKVLVGIARGAR
jgi:hypothetical protein